MLRVRGTEPDVDIATVGKHELMVRLKASAYAYFAHLEVPNEATRFSDGYLDLEPGQERMISVTNEKRSQAGERQSQMALIPVA